MKKQFLEKLLIDDDLSAIGFTAQAIASLRWLTWVEEPTIANQVRKMLERERIPLVIELGHAPLPTEHGDFTYFAFGDLSTGNRHSALVYGNYDERSLGDGERILVRIHSSCRTSEIFGAINCECRDQLVETLKRIKEEGQGVVLYLDQEGRGNGVYGKIHQLNNMFTWRNGKIIQQTSQEGKRIDTDTAYKMAGFPSEIRDFEVAAEMLRHLGVKSVRLLTNNPSKIRPIKEAGIPVINESIHIPPANQIIASDLKSKAENLGHLIPSECYTITSNNDIT